MRNDTGASSKTNLVYPADIALLTDFTLSEGVNLTINEATAGTGWAATGTHDGLGGPVWILLRKRICFECGFRRLLLASSCANDVRPFRAFRSKP